ncbi:MAG: phage holin family protein [bacterium]|nr:phage holin family protein [bacterium]
MKGLLRNYLINLGALWAVSQSIPSFVITGGLQGLLVGALAFMLANILLVPLVKVLLLPLNLLTLGIFAWLSNVLALYFLMIIIPNFKLFPYHFPGISFSGFVIPEADLTTFQIAIVVSLMMGLMIHFVQWLVK